MVIQDWSENIVMVDLADDPDLADDLNAVMENMEKAAKDVVLNFTGVKFMNSSNQF